MNDRIHIGPVGRELIEEAKKARIRIGTIPPGTVLTEKMYYPGSIVRSMDTVQFWRNKLAEDIVCHEAFMRLFRHKPVKPLSREQQLRLKLSDLRDRLRDALLVLRGRAYIAEGDD
jgi:hypothetical protein